MRKLEATRRILIVAVMMLLGAQLFAAPSRNRAGGIKWVEFAPASASIMQLEKARLADVNGPRPIVLLETNYYTFLPSEQLQLRLTVNPNGYASAVTLYLYNENRTTGERRYYNTAGSLLDAGQQSDLFGSVGSPLPILTPTLSDFVLFGSTSDTSQISFGVNGALGAARAAGPIGLYQWVAELRDVAGKRVLARSNAMYSNISQSLPVSGEITSNTTWSANNRYVLSEFVGVTSGNTLTIEPGTVIYGGTTRATLFVLRGAKIIADGTARRPIIFTSANRVGSRSQQDWGSLVLLGRAPLNRPLGEELLEGLPSGPTYTYGGTNAADSSGILRYVRLEFGGFPIAQNQEINGLTLGGVGNGTVIDYVEVLQNKDDGFEFFGGTVNAKHLLGIGIADDGLDFDYGYAGSVQFAAMIKRHVQATTPEEGDSNIFVESDNNGNGNPDLPFTNPKVYNVTAIRVTNNAGNFGGVIRRSSAGKYYNNIVAGSFRAPITIRDTNTFTNVTSGELILDNNIFFGDFGDSQFTSSDRPADTRNFLFTTMKNNRNVDPMLAIGTPTLLKTLMPDLEPLPGSPALDADLVANPPDNGFLEQVDFIGAVGPGDNWILSGWANFSDN